MPHPVALMYNITYTGSQTHIRKYELYYIFPPPKYQWYLIPHLSLWSYCEGSKQGEGEHPCVQDTTLGVMGRKQLPPAAGNCGSGITRWCSCTYSKLFSSQLLRFLRFSLNFVLQMTVWTEQYQRWFQDRRDAWWEQHLHAQLCCASLSKEWVKAVGSHNKCYLTLLFSWCCTERCSLEQPS